MTMGPVSSGCGRREHHRGPSALAVADDRGLRALRVQLAHLAHERLLGVAHVDQRLARLGVAKEDDEVDGMALAQRDAHLRVVLEAADSRAVSRARVDDDVRSPLGIDGDAVWRNDPHQRVVHRTRERAPVDDRLVVEVQHGRQALLRMLDEVVAALADRVPEQDGALRRVHCVAHPVRPHAGARRGVAHAVVGGCLGEALPELVARVLRALAEKKGDLSGDVLASRQLCFGVHEMPRVARAHRRARRGIARRT